MIGMLSAVSAMAQEASSEKLERIEITGSRIRQIDAETAQPVLKLTAQDIQKSGLVTLGDIVNQLSSAGTPDFSKGQTLASNREQGGDYPNLRNLGSQRLLVLVNGKRWAQTVAGFTDLSTIPSSLVERIEVLKDGGSSAYGSDALAGVINFILKKSLDGGSVSVMTGANEAGDGKRNDFNLSYGLSGDKGSLMFGLTYSKQGEVWAKDRDITAYSYGPDFKTGGLGIGPWGRVRSTANGAATGSTYVLNHTGSYDGVGVGQASNDIANYHVGATADDSFNSTQQMMFTIPTELKSFFTHGSLDLSPSMRLSSTAMFAERNSVRQIAGYPLQSTSQSAYPVYIDKDSYYNPFGNQGVGVAAGAGVDAFFQRRITELPRVTENNNRTTHFDAALEGDMSIAGRAWTWSAGVNYSNVSGEALNSGNINLVNLKKALGPSFMNAQGAVQCGTAAAPITLGTGPGSCVPFNILGGPSASTAQALEYINQRGVTTYGATVKSLTADISGEIMKLPGGMMTAAAGLERRNVKGYDKPGVFEQNGLSTDLAGQSTTGDYTVKEAYVEVNLPLLKGVPGAEQLVLNLATRYSDYSNFGNTTNSKGSLLYRPIKDVLLRGTYAEGFRAPTLDDIAGGGSQSFASYTDPCDTRFGAAANTPEVQARCLAAGVPADFRQRGQNGLPITAPNTQSPYPFQQGAGNSFLQPETATTKTLGFVYSPSYLQGLTVGLDWYLIELKNRITGVTASALLNECYVNNVTALCGLHTRDSTGQVNAAALGNVNQGGLRTEGFDLSVGYRFPATSWGRFNLRSETTYVKKYEVKSTATSNWGPFSLSAVGENDIYRVKSNIGIDWTMGDFGVTLGTRYYSATKTTCWDTDPDAPVYCSNPTGEWSGGTGFNKLKALVYNDLSASYKTPWKGTLLVGVNNVFDKKPRINFDIGSSSSAVNAELPIDRSWFVRYTQQF
ncbi:MAG: TonB-dependent receptor [Roseateles sp.]|uniref:TonB-dependent receptor domain-containing protein n=1 Tax=Roseateles sp. TaxID=1971397 RepID=UPI0039E98255